MTSWETEKSSVESCKGGNLHAWRMVDETAAEHSTNLPVLAGTRPQELYGLLAEASVGSGLLQ